MNCIYLANEGKTILTFSGEVLVQHHVLSSCNVILHKNYSEYNPVMRLLEKWSIYIFVSSFPKSFA